MTDDDKEMEIEGSADDVRAAIAQLSNPDTSATDVAPPSPEAEAPESSAERARDASGKFIAKSAVEQPVAESAPAPEVTDADRLSEQPVQQSNAVTPPTSWSADAKAVWASLPAAVQQAAFKREQEMVDGQRQWSEQRQTVERTLAPLHELSQQNGINWQDGLNRLLNVENQLRNPQTAPQMIAQMAQAYGVDLAALVNGNPQPQRQQPQFDPNQLISQAREEARRETQTLLQDQAINSQVQQFAAANGPDGKPVHPHFETVKQDMGLLLQSGKAQTMQEAYDKAVWLYPETRPQPQIQVNSQQQVQKAKRASVSVNGAPQNGQATPKANGFDANTSTRDDVREAMRLLQH